jgi:predicted secreted protein
MERDFGMVQMPCPEQQVWGGVLKPLLLAAYGLRSRHPWLFRFRRPLIRLGLSYTRSRYRRIAARVANEIQDYTRSGLHVASVVAVDGSPSCGLNSTVGREALFDLMAVTTDALDSAIIARKLTEHLRGGNGIFIAELRSALERRGCAPSFIGHDLLGELRGEASSALIPQ